jgi:hypothetical protein
VIGGDRLVRLDARDPEPLLVGHVVSLHDDDHKAGNPGRLHLVLRNPFERGEVDLVRLRPDGRADGNGREEGEQTETKRTPGSNQLLVPKLARITGRTNTSNIPEGACAGA